MHYTHCRHLNTSHNRLSPISLLYIYPLTFLLLSSLTVPPTTNIYTFPYTTLFRSDLVTGTLSIHQAGYGFLIIETPGEPDRKSTRLNSSHPSISYAVFCLKKKN